MIIQCSKCQKKYKIDSEKVTEKGVKVTCQSCGNVMVIRKPPEDAQKEITPCSVCGHPATKGLDTDAPLCNRCYDIEQEKTARFVEFSKPKSGPATQERELDLTSGKDFSFDSISGGDFAPSAYSTDVLPGEGKGYVPPERIPLTSVVGGDGSVNFEDIGDSQQEPFMGSAQVQEKPPAAPLKPGPPPKTASPVQTPGGKAPPSQAPPKDATPPPRPIPRSPTPPAGPAGKTSPGGVGVKDLTPPPSTAIPKPRPAQTEPTDHPAPGSDKKKPPKAEAVTLEPVDEGNEEAAQVTSGAEVTSLGVIVEEQEAPKRASIVPIILSFLLLLALFLYFFAKFVDTGSL